MLFYAAPIFLPLFGAVLAGLFGRTIGARASQIATCGAMGAAAVLSVVVFNEVVLQGEVATITLFDWFSSGDLDVDWLLRFDELTAVMVFVVCVVSFLIHVYSIGYMAHDPHVPRFFAYLSLFTFFMLALVTADNFLQMFFGWEGVGLVSYLLIGFWYRRPAANAAAIKAFLVNRVGDFGFALGILAIFLMFDTVSFDAVFTGTPGDGGRGAYLPRPFLRLPGGRLHPALRRRHGKVGTVPVTHMAARRDGRSDAGLRPDPRRNHGDRRRLHGGAAVACL